jgi:hypothetical protein
LHEVLDYGRNLLGISQANAEEAPPDAKTPPVAASATNTDDNRDADRGTAPPAPDPHAPVISESGTPRIRLQTDQSPTGADRDTILKPGWLTRPSQQSPTVSGSDNILQQGWQALTKPYHDVDAQREYNQQVSGNSWTGGAWDTMKNKLADYLNGEHAMSPEQLTARMAETAKSNPTYDYSQNIRQTFEDTVKNHGMEAGHQFVQALREPQQKAQALATLAVEKGQITDATLKAIDYSHNIVPTDTTLTTGFDHARNLFVATLTPHSGGEPTKFALTPAQMHSFLAGPASQFDHIAENGTGKNLTIASGGGNATRDLQLLSDPHAPAASVADTYRRMEPQIAGLEKFLPTGYLNTQAGREAVVRAVESGDHDIANTSDVGRTALARAALRIAPPAAAAPPAPDSRSTLPAGARVGYINADAAPYQSGQPATGAPLPPPPPVDRLTPVDKLTPRQLDAARAQLTPQDSESAAQRQRLTTLVGPENMGPQPTREQRTEWGARRAKLVEDYHALQKAAEPVSPAIVRANTQFVSTDPRIAPSVAWGSSRSIGKGSASSSVTPHPIPGMPAQSNQAQMEANRRQQEADVVNAGAWNAEAIRRQATAAQALKEYGPAPWERPGWHNRADQPLPESVFQRGPIQQAAQQPAAAQTVQAAAQPQSQAPAVRQYPGFQAFINANGTVKYIKRLAQ